MSSRQLNFSLVAIAGLTFIDFLRYYQTTAAPVRTLKWLLVKHLGARTLA